MKVGRTQHLVLLSQRHDKTHIISNLDSVIILQFPFYYEFQFFLIVVSFCVCLCWEAYEGLVGQFQYFLITIAININVNSNATLISSSRAAQPSPALWLASILTIWLLSVLWLAGQVSPVHNSTFWLLKRCENCRNILNF